GSVEHDRRRLPPGEGLLEGLEVAHGLGVEARATEHALHHLAIEAVVVEHEHLVRDQTRSPLLWRGTSGTSSDNGLVRGRATQGATRDALRPSEEHANWASLVPSGVPVAVDDFLLEILVCPETKE